MQKKTVYRILLILMLTLVSVIIGVVTSNILVMTIKGEMDHVLDPQAFLQSISADKRHRLLCFIISALALCGLCFAAFWKRSITPAKTQTETLTPDIEIPVTSGQGQHGTARFATDEDVDRMYPVQHLNAHDQLLHQLLKAGKQDQREIDRGVFTPPKALDEIPAFPELGGLPIAMKSNGDIESIRLISGDKHVLCIGTTRCGKTRTLVLQSIACAALAGNDMINTDPKGELYQYTWPMLRRLGYKTFALDFKNPKRSHHYNFLQMIIDAVNSGDISKAISAAWDFVDALVEDGKNTEPIWTNGEKGLLAAAAMQIVYDNSPEGLAVQYPELDLSDRMRLYEDKHRWYQNCINLYHYISKMCNENPKTKNTLLSDVIASLPDDHPAKLTLAITESAPSKMRGSFVTSALTTLRLFTDPNIADMTAYTDEVVIDFLHKKAIFIILPDFKQTYYPLASLFVNQYYQYLADVADERGGRLMRNCVFNLDEFGNFTKLPFFDGKLTVGAGRGILFRLYLQSKEQLDEKYGEKLAKIIMDNCVNWIYLQSGTETAEYLSKTLGKYTVLTSSASASVNDHGVWDVSLQSGSSSTSTQLMGRELMTAKEIQLIKRPYLLVMCNNDHPYLAQAPDLSRWLFNTMMGLGDEEHNTKVREVREHARAGHAISALTLWDFLPYIDRLIESRDYIEDDEPEDQRMMREIAQSFEGL